ncbi:HNH/endonuclease VII fold putative polymorphic toxin [Gandjariella thermophila]|uniref:HNH/Endo VII superfamily nuclease toxins domain-containing protein n=1 Tax=Gandjariella thermophila TaxID=1931992 RepID=A0A4D4JEH4_9PSEU|nr:HNH/endonuclease VII fold putative polymorphic toxin [Gandjariella thermophila]GDY34054.1 hypothetical protein GTS_56870 [Gandjariella thermophila]
MVEQVDFVWDGTTLAEQTAWEPGGARVTTWEHDGLRPATQTERTWWRDAPQAWVDERFYAIVTDLVGTPSELVDDLGAVAGHARSTLWGTTTWTGDSAGTPLRFPGQYHDPETGLNYNYFRYYDPETARYATLDPLGLAPSPNPNTYVHNPHTWTDPLGLSPCDSPGRNAALNQAKRDLGIPRSQHPDEVNRVPMTDRWGHAILGGDGKPIMTREYVYTRPDGSRVIIQDHGAGHSFGEGGVGDQGPHLNVRPPENTRTGSVPGARDHYPFAR